MNALLARITSPVVWQLPGHGAAKLHGFAQAEHGSMLDLRAAAMRTESPSRRALYLRHALDEARHATMFTRRSAELRRARGALPLGPVHADTERLFERLGEIGFLAFVHRGERRGRAQFEAYRDFFGRRGDDKSRAMFETILGDERRHESYTRELLVELAGGERPARTALRRAAAWEAWRMWRRAGRFVAELVYAVLMLVLYIVLAPFALGLKVLRPARKGWNRAPGEGAPVPHAPAAPEDLAPSR